MKIRVEIVTERLEAMDLKPAGSASSGALAEFWGTVRDEEGEAKIEALHYESYEPMAQAEMTRILRELAVEFPCHEVSVVHRRGWIPVGETAIYVGVRSKHRGEAFGLLIGFMNRLKKDVPIWKTESKAC